MYGAEGNIRTLAEAQSFPDGNDLADVTFPSINMHYLWLTDI
jgi:hypothetical protein